MRDAGRKHYRLAALGETMPVRNNIADQLGTIDTLGEFAFDVITVPSMDALEVRSARREHSRRDQIFKVDQFMNLRAFNQRRKCAA